MENQKFTTREYAEAQKAVNERIGFYIHLCIYLIINVFLHIINWRTGSGYWAFYPAAGWGIGLLFHGLRVFGIFNNSNWKHKQIQKEIEKQRSLKNYDENHYH